MDLLFNFSPLNLVCVFICVYLIIQFYEAVDNVVEAAIVDYRLDGDLTNLLDFTQREVRCSVQSDEK